MTTSRTGANNVTRSKGLDLLKGNAMQAIENSASMGKIFGATWVTVGDVNTPPREITKALRLDVSKYVKGGTRAFAPDEQGYLGVYEMMNENRALLKYQSAAKRQLYKLRLDLPTAQQTAKNLRIDLKAKKDSGARGTKSLENKLATANRKVEKLQAQIAAEALKLSNPNKALVNEINARIASRQAELSATTDPSKRAELWRRIESERSCLQNPIESVMGNYRLLNTRGLLSLRIDGTEYIITTPPVPARPSK